MKTIEIDGKSYLIDIEKATEQGSLKERDSKPRSWKEYTLLLKCKVYRSASDYDGAYPYDAFCTTEKLKAFNALGRLIQLRDAWVGDWEPDPTGIPTFKYVIYRYGNTIYTNSHRNSRILSFPTAEMRDDFLETFRDLIEEAKMFL